MTSPLPAAPPFTDGWNEAFAAPGRPRPLYGPLLRALAPVDKGLLTAAVVESIEAARATFSSDPLVVCPIPRLIEGSEWIALSAALAQRVRALSAFVVDAYGPRAIVAAGIVPAAVIDDAEGYEPELRGRWPGGPTPLGVAGLDVVRDRDGQLRVLEDNTRTPSGFAYAVAARDAVTATLGGLAPAVGSTTPAPVPLEPAIVAALRATLGDAAEAVRGSSPARAGSAPSVVVLTDGSGSSAFFEHATAARWLEAPLVTLDDLERRGDELWLRAGKSGPARRVDALYRRTGTDRLRDDLGAPTPVAELLLEPWLAGRLAVVNAFGTGVADDKLVHAYVEEMIRCYLGEEPLLRSVQTLDLNDPVVLERVLADLRGHVIKPRHGHGGHGVVVCAHAVAADVRRVGEALRRPAAGAEYVAQPTVALSIHPTIVGDRLTERHIDLRPFAFATRNAVEVIPGGLTRVARDAGSLVVNSSQEGGAKDTWVLTSDRHTSAQAHWSEWNDGTQPYTVGLEEEVMLLDPSRKWTLAQRIDDVLEALPDALAGYVSAETHQAAIELATDPHASVGAAVAQLRRLRDELVDGLETLGLAAAVTGTHPSADWSETEITSASRYQLIHQTMRDLATREPTFALHVHVGVPDPDRAIALYNRMRVHLPLLLALSGNSPFWRGRDSGFASARTILFQAFPRTGLPRRYASYGEWVEAVDLQIRSKALPEATFLWWDVRPQPRFGTVEVRVMDAQSHVADTAALAALVQSIARLELEEGYVADHIVRAEEVLAENRFIAARDGVSARLIDTTEESLRPVSELLTELLEAARPHAEVLGCAGELARVPALAAAPGAARQRTYPADPAGLAGLVAALAAAFTVREP